MQMMVKSAGRVRDAYERALGRPPAAKEMDRALSFIAQVERAMKDRNQDPAERRVFAWQSFCKSLIAKKSSCAFNVSQTHCRRPYHATAHGTSLIINSFSFIQNADCWMSGGK